MTIPPDHIWDLAEQWLDTNEGFRDRSLKDGMFTMGLYLCVNFMASMDAALERVGVDPEVRERALQAFMADQADQVRADDFALQHAKVLLETFPPVR